MRNILILASVVSLAACSQTQLQTAVSTDEQIVCQVQLAGGGVAAVTAASAAIAAASPSAAPVAGIASGVIKSDIDAKCSALLASLPTVAAPAVAAPAVVPAAK